ncbi:2-oxo acid dehydrogenase subunit E2 [Amphritea atlantica]|uniref:Dihydrolipoamide acetyltransferase component of pyruvate dehydrogenase complex n=1 Tax=Amphritea atlantica TaxID=355243 RepID=A0ABY5GY16_9GAMM|nr:2-oxo acid dehydrogenase subunit E2 [Amphritea atlantica]
MSKIIDVTMPSLGADMTEGTLVEWQAKPGDTLNKGDIIALLETQKGMIDMEVYQQGVITELLLEPVVSVPVGTVMARMSVAGEAARPAAPEASYPVAQAAAIKSPPVTSDQSQQTVIPQPNRPRQGLLASPVVRKLAAEQQLDLSRLSGSGPEGAILLRDLPANGPEANAAGSPDPAQAMRSAIAAAMAKSKREIPHYYLSLEIDITRAQRWLADFNAERGPEERILLLALLLKAVARSLHKYPALNGYYQQQTFTPNSAIHIGNVISLREGGLVVPAIHDVDQLSVEEIMVRLRDMSERSRRGVLRSSELLDASITVSNMGERGSDLLFGVIYPPQVAIIGIGKPRKTMLIKDDQPELAEVVTVSLAADHRVSDGMTGARFLNALANKLQKPEKL